MKLFDIRLAWCALALFLAACGTQAAIVNLTTDQAVVQVQGDDMSVAMETAQQGCAVHKRNAVPISQQCLDQWCVQKRLLFACAVPDATNTPAMLPTVEPSAPNDASGRYYRPDEMVMCTFPNLNGAAVAYKTKTCVAGGGRILGPAPSDASGAAYPPDASVLCSFSSAKPPVPTSARYCSEGGGAIVGARAG